MLRKIRNRIEDESGFTLIELLVVILIIGILAAIALPAFLGQRAKGQDSQAKSNVRNAVSQVESCYANSPADGYNSCETPSNTGLTFVTAAPDAEDEVQVTASQNGGSGPYTGFAVVAWSKSGNTFTITKSASTGASSRSCSSAGSSDGGCSTSTW